MAENLTDDIVLVVRHEMRHVNPHELLGYLSTAIRSGQSGPKVARDLREVYPAPAPVAPVVVNGHTVVNGQCPRLWDPAEDGPWA